MKKRLSIFLILLLALSMSLSGCAKKSVENETAPETKAEESESEAETKTEDKAEAESEKSESHVASSSDMTEVEDVVEEGMVPIYAADLLEGTYPVEMVSSSSMFKADHCELVVEGDEMKAILYMTSEAYPYMFAGTGEEADAAQEEEYILPEEIGDGMRTFTLPISALDSGESFAAFSKKKELWYDRTLLFRMDSLPEEAFRDGFFVTAESLGLSEGEYIIEVALAGGSGRATVESPAKVVVNSDGPFAEIIWSSPNYDYMRIGEEKFLPTNEEGNSTFMIPISYFDRPMKVAADTTAMSEPHEIDYTLNFNSQSIKPAE